ncbi:CLUMA_CG019671, isoform A [Clunio marinus]|uniref:CLUMA_CG019671, isoform A n=1 Tax=Clunio marinus TaxID=568069 RepID=A0A1J1J1Y0_9DIPT|nr:CLUMA_CG019671, isoform A [Clunio marinus]
MRAPDVHDGKKSHEGGRNLPEPSEAKKIVYTIKTFTIFVASIGYRYQYPFSIVTSFNAHFQPALHSRYGTRVTRKQKPFLQHILPIYLWELINHAIFTTKLYKWIEIRKLLTNIGHQIKGQFLIRLLYSTFPTILHSITSPSDISVGITIRG